MLTLQVPDDLALPYKDLACKAGRDLPEFILEALSTYLEDLEDERIVRERLAHPLPSLSLEEAKKQLGLG